MQDLVIYPPGEKKAMEWITALSAEAIRFRVDRDPYGWVLFITPDQAERAEACIRGYEQDNLDWPPKPRVKAPRKTPLYDVWTAYGMALLIAIFYIWLGPYDGDRTLLRAASADSEAIRAGEWWRVFTAMTLHSGFPHLAGNALFLGWMGHMVCRRFGGGLGAVHILASGACANALVAWLSPDPHNAVGASTACFGALGILAMNQAVTFLKDGETLRSIWSRAWVPIGAAIALLGFTGASPGSDLAGHLFGFAAGMVLVVPVAMFKKTRWPEWSQRLLELVALLTLLASWKMAFNAV